MNLPRIGFTAKIFLSILAGALSGLFFGEMTTVFDPVGQAFIGLMQITVIPTVVIFIITGIGTLSETDAVDFLRKVAGVVLVIWGLGVLVFFAMQYAFPPVQPTSFFSTSGVSGGEETDLISLFIPSNIFTSLAEGLMPAIVLFCVLLGWALIGDARNRPFIELLRNLEAALSRITGLLMAVVPVGVFAITAVTFGTLTWPQLLQIQVYYVSAVVLCLVLALVILPLLVYSLTPWTYREILVAAHRGVLMGFATARVFIALPLLTEGVAGLFRSPTAGEEPPGAGAAEPGTDTTLPVEERAAAYGGVLVPLAYSLPTLGAFVVLLFVLFAAWYYNDLFTLQEQALLALLGVPSLFGSAKVSLPFILQMMRLPADAMELYLVASPLQVYFTAALSCMSIFALSAIGTAFLTGVGRLRVRRALISAAVGAVALVSVVVVLNAAFGAVLATSPQEDATVLGLTMPTGPGGAPVGEQFATTVYRDYAGVPPATQPPGGENATLLDRVRARGVLRVGYIPNAMPFCYFNREGELVGHDVQMAYDLAGVLNVSRVEFVPVDRENALDRVNAGGCDIVMTGLVLVSPMMQKARYTAPYMDLHLALVTRDERTGAFEDLDAVARTEGLRIAVAGDTDYDRAAAALFPRATIVPLEDPEQFFDRADADALLTTAETGTPLTLLHPFYAVAAVQYSGASAASSVYALARECDDVSLLFVDYWLAMEERSGALEAKYDYWVLGKETGRRAPRWSVIRDVLHWVR